MLNEPHKNRDWVQVLAKGSNVPAVSTCCVTDEYVLFIVVIISTLFLVHKLSICFSKMSNKTSSASEQSFVYPSGAPGCFLWVSLCATFSFHVVFCEPLFVFFLFPLAIVLFAYRFTDSDTTSTGYWWQFPGVKRTVLFRLDRDPSRWRCLIVDHIG